MFPKIDPFFVLFWIRRWGIYVIVFPLSLQAGLIPEKSLSRDAFCIFYENFIRDSQYSPNQG